MGDVQIKVFEYLPELDCLKVTDEFLHIAKQLRLEEHNPSDRASCEHYVTWIGRLFNMDNDVGEHLLDNSYGRDELMDKAAQYGLDVNHLVIIEPRQFQDGAPCHSDELRKKFWMDVLSSLHISLDTLYSKAREEHRRSPRGLSTLEKRFEEIQALYHQQ